MVSAVRQLLPYPVPSDVRVTVEKSSRGFCFLRIGAGHYTYWLAVRLSRWDFRGEVERFGGLAIGKICPEFPSVGKLFEWLSYVKYGEVKKTLVLAATLEVLNGNVRG